MDNRIEPGDVPRVVDSPVRRLLGELGKFFRTAPAPRVPTAAARHCGEALGRHLLNLIAACGEMNINGFHSASLGFLRPMEDALDCFAAVTLVAGAAECWQLGNLKPSDAAKLWIARAQFTPISGETFGEYRQRLRSTFNHLAHCSPDLVRWDLFVEQHPDEDKLFRIRINHDKVILPNAQRIDAFLVAHIWEFLAIVELAYTDQIAATYHLRDTLESIRDSLHAILVEQHAHGALNTIDAPELESGPECVQELEAAVRSVTGIWDGRWDCSGVEEEQLAVLRISQVHTVLSGTLTARVRQHHLTERVSGVIYRDEVFLDGFEFSVSPVKMQVETTLDTFQLSLSPSGDTLQGAHSCSLGIGEASFEKRA